MLELQTTKSKLNDLSNSNLSSQKLLKSAQTVSITVSILSSLPKIEPFLIAHFARQLSWLKR